ncbi:MAG: CmpA/NrtA family ABC transporter substrate-binding protein [Elusimicrobiota bacterium]
MGEIIEGPANGGGTGLDGLTRRGFLKTAGAAAAAAVLPGLPVNWAGPVWASDAPERPDMRLGIIALTDCSSIVMAHELGLFKKHGINSTISKEASWAVIRDRMNLGENQATHMLIGMPYASTMGLQGSPKNPMIIPMHLNHNGQAITVQKKYLGKVKTAADFKPLAAAAKAAGNSLTFAMTYPPGTHAMWMRYWLAEGGLHPDKDVALVTIPPAQMVQNMKIDKMDGFCVGEPWNNRAIKDGIGYTAVTTQQIWRDHPEKVLAFRADFAEKNPKTVKACLKAVIEASQYVQKMENREKVCEVVSKPQYINCPKEIILDRMMGRYDYGDGRPVEQDPYSMVFFDRNATFPWKSHGTWWLTQFRRWGFVNGAPDYKGVVDKVHRPDIYREAAKEMGLAAPSSDSRGKEIIMGKAFDPAKPEEYAKSFAIHSLA